mmetsp:Transcript_8396/g.23502  ORF Transcript_8396/g.23502 Transcript_8396/m.23502 type:complete len:239 (-) Transcript_8396:804-1520(-)
MRQIGIAYHRRQHFSAKLDGYLGVAVVPLPDFVEQSLPAHLGVEISPVPLFLITEDGADRDIRILYLPKIESRFGHHSGLKSGRNIRIDGNDIDVRMIAALCRDRSLKNQQIFLQHILGKRLQHRLELLGLGGEGRIGKYANVFVAVLVGIVRYRNNEGMVVVARALGHTEVDARTDVDDKMILAARTGQAEPTAFSGVNLEPMALRRPGTVSASAVLGRLGRSSPVNQRSSEIQRGQ